MSAFPRKKSKTQSSLNFLQSGPRKFSKSDFSGLAPIRRALIWDFPDFSGIFPICSGMVRGFSRFVLFLLFLSLLRAPTRNSPERVRDTIWTFPEKSGKPPGLETPGLASLNKSACKIRLARSSPRVGNGLPTFDTNISVLKFQGSVLQRCLQYC